MGALESKSDNNVPALAILFLPRKETRGPLTRLDCLKGLYHACRGAIHSFWLKFVAFTADMIDCIFHFMERWCFHDHTRSTTTYGG